MSITVGEKYCLFHFITPTSHGVAFIRLGLVGAIGIGTGQPARNVWLLYKDRQTTVVTVGIGCPK
jgi:hypothetical protein